MASNPFLDAINFPTPTSTQSNFDPNAFAQSLMSGMHGADLSGMQPTWNTSPDFIKAMANSGPSGGSSLPGVAPSTAPSNPLASIWHGITNLYGRAKGGLENAAALQLNGQANNPMTRDWQGLQAVIQGFQHPDVASQNFAQGQQNLHNYIQNDQGALNKLVDWTTPMTPTAKQNWADFVTNSATDPLTYIPLPVGKAAELAGVTLKGASKAIGLPKALEALKTSAPDAVRKPLNAITSLLTPISGARQPFLNAVSRMTGKTQSGANKVRQTLLDVFQNTTPEQRIALTHALESTPKGEALNDPTLEALRQRIEPLMEQATQHSLAKNLIGNTINPADFGVGRYIPHVNLAKLDETATPFSDVTRRNPTIDASKARNLEGTIQAINGGRDSKVFEDDLAKILGYHFGQINKASTERDLIDEAMQHGLPLDGEVKAGEQFPGTFQRAVEYTSPHTGESVLLPESEARYLQQLRAPNQEFKSTLKNGYRGAVNAFNRIMFTTSPLVHILNNLGTQTLTHAPDVFAKMPSYMKEAWRGVEPGSKMDEALKSGALHLSSILKGATNSRKLANGIAKELDAKPGPLNALKSISKGYMDLTPRVEQAYRAAAFEHALDNGMTPDEAANWIRSIYGGRIAGDAASPLENATAAFMPFINWTKTAIKSNATNALKNPAPYLAGFDALNNYNKTVTGHGMGDNPNPLSIALPWADKSGNPEYWSMYAPPFDVDKLAKDVGENGARGLLDFGFKRTNPLVRFAGQAATGEQDPFANPNDKFNVDPYPALPSTFNNRGVFFGDKGPQVPAYAAQAAQDVINPFATVNDARTNGLRDTMLSQLLGGYINAPNPQSAQKQQKWQQGEIQRELKSYMKKHPGGQ